MELPVVKAVMTENVEEVVVAEVVLVGCGVGSSASIVKVDRCCDVGKSGRVVRCCHVIMPTTNNATAPKSIFLRVGMLPIQPRTQ